MLGVDLQRLRRYRSWRFMAVNSTWQLIPWADVLYAGDYQWWARYGEQAAAFRGRKFARELRASLEFGPTWIRGRDAPGLCTKPGWIHTGGNSGYAAINLAWSLGASRIVLLGFDMHRRDGAHWHGEHVGMLSAPDRHFPLWRRAFEPLAHDLSVLGVRVVNATVGSDLRCFPSVDLFKELSAR